MNHLTFAHPYLLLLLLIIPLMVVWYLLRYRKQKPALQFSNIAFFKGLKKTFRQRTYPLLFVLRMVAIGALIVALARPQTMLSRQEMKVEGIDIVLAMDVSGSMLVSKTNREGYRCSPRRNPPEFGFCGGWGFTGNPNV